MNIIILGSHRFYDQGKKVGIQHIAEGLASKGHCVDYISIPVSLISILYLKDKIRVNDFFSVWIKRLDKNGINISNRLNEYSFRVFFPFRRNLFKCNWQIKSILYLLPKWIKIKKYDVCIHDASPTFLYLNSINSNNKILRLNDLPTGFLFSIHQNIINVLEKNIENGIYDEVWPVSAPLSNYIKKHNSSLKIETIPNGINLELFNGHFRNKANSIKKAIFIGVIESWIDLDLLEKTAKILNDWTFNIFGPLNISWKITSDNIHYKGIINKNDIPEVLKQHSIGIIPFKETKDQIMSVMERPLKFYEYLAVGLGVAATDVGAMREGMGQWAEFGNNPESFANAIIKAEEKSRNWDRYEIYKYLRKFSWLSIIDKINNKISNLLN